MALFLFLSTIEALSTLLSALFVALRLLSPFFPTLSAEACAILQALWWSPQHQQVCHFSSLLLSEYRSLLRFPLLCPSFYLTVSGTTSRNYPFSPSQLSTYSKYPVTHFFQEMTWPDGVRCSGHTLSQVVSLSSYLAYPLFLFRGLKACCLIKIL